MAVNETYELALLGSYHGQAIVTTHHFREYAPWVSPPSAEQSLIDKWQALQTAWRNLYPTSYSLVTIRARKVCGTLPLPEATEEGVNLAGTRSGVTAVNEWPAWIALLVTERTGNAGRSYRGRYFIPGVSDTDCDGDNFTTSAGNLYALVGTYNDALMALFGPSGSDGTFRLVVHSRKLASVPGTQCQQSSTPVTSLVRSIRPATMKSRKS